MNLLQRGGLGARAGRAFVAATGRHPSDIAAILRRDEHTITSMMRGAMSIERVIELVKTWNGRVPPAEQVRFVLEVQRSGTSVSVERSPDAEV